MERKEYWALFVYGVNDTICSKHKTYRAAVKAATACEKRCGANHRIVEVTVKKPYAKAKRAQITEKE